MKRPTLKRKVTTYTVVTWELSYDGEEPAAEGATASAAKPEGEPAAEAEPAPQKQAPAPQAAEEDAGG